MPLNKQRGNMYGWVTHTFNPLAGECPHRCNYCYVNNMKSNNTLKIKYSGPPRLIRSELDTNLGEYNIIFIQNMSDLFANEVDYDDILKVLQHCNKYPKNKYLFQTKNPKRFQDFINLLRHFDDVILGTTIESNYNFYNTKALSPEMRHVDFISPILDNFLKMVSIEPMLVFDYDVLIEWIRDIDPFFVSIGADSKNNGLEEPDEQEIIDLVNGLKEFTNVKLKSNLRRLAPSLF